jgi:hypothetical protein
MGGINFGWLAVWVLSPDWLSRKLKDCEFCQALRWSRRAWGEGSAGRAPTLRRIPWHLPYNLGKITEKPQSGQRQRRSKWSEYLKHEGLPRHCLGPPSLKKKNSIIGRSWQQRSVQLAIIRLSLSVYVWVPRLSKNAPQHHLSKKVRTDEPKHEMKWRKTKSIDTLKQSMARSNDPNSMKYYTWILTVTWIAPIIFGVIIWDCFKDRWKLPPDPCPQKLDLCLHRYTKVTLRH